MAMVCNGRLFAHTVRHTAGTAGFAVESKVAPPKTTRHHWSGVPQRRAREFDEEQARLAVLREFEARASAAVDKLRQKWSSPEN